MRFEPISQLDARCLMILRDHVDTDQVIPARFLYRARKDGFKGLLFHDFLEQISDVERQALDGVHDTDSGFKILLAGENFGCGSSREHAVWALIDNGFRAVIARSFGDIFYGNAINNGLAVIRLTDHWSDLVHDVSTAPMLHVDIARQRIRSPRPADYTFEIDAFFKNMLTQGVQEVDMTLTKAAQIEEFERKTARLYPWLQSPKLQLNPQENNQ